MLQFDFSKGLSNPNDIHTKFVDWANTGKIKGFKPLVIDIEANGLDFNKIDRIWCISTIDPISGEKVRFHPSTEGPESYHTEFGDSFVSHISSYDMFIGQNFLGYDAFVLNKLLGTDFGPHNTIDTLVLSRLFRPVSPPLEMFGKFKAKGWDNRVGGHSIEAWGHRLGYHKIAFDDFSQFTFAQMDYCGRDTEVNLLQLKVLLKEQKEFQFSVESIELEHQAHWLLSIQTYNGFTLDFQKAEALRLETDALIEEYTAELHKVFPPKKKAIKTFVPRSTAKGDMHGQDKKTLLNNLHEKNEDGSFTLFTMETFNPNSPAQIADRLMELGWKPRKFTATGQASTSKETLSEAIDCLAATTPEVEALRRFSIVTDRNAKAKKWIELAQEDGKVHGRVNHIGPWTHRSSHFDDNMANIARVVVDKDGKPIEGLMGAYGWDCRSCWVPRKGWTLIGCDAAGIQLRALAHYMGDPEYIKKLLEEDIHVVNQLAAGIATRAKAKTFIYAWLLGAGDEKIGIIVEVDPSEYDQLFNTAKNINKYNRFRDHVTKGLGPKDNLLWYYFDKLSDDGRNPDKQLVATCIKGAITKQKFLDSLPALNHFKNEVIPAAAKETFMVSIDGRKIWVNSAHLAMGAYLQGFEAVIMKKAMVLYHKKLHEMGIPFAQCAFVHDEFQVECPPEHAKTVGETIKASIVQAGVELGSLCPLDGDWREGRSWAHTH